MWCHLAHGLGVGTCKTCSACRPCIWCPPRATIEPHTRHNVPMIPKPLQFLLLAPLAFGHMAPRFFLGLFALGLAGLALWWLRLVLLGLFGD